MYKASSLEQVAKMLDISVATVADAFNRPEQLSSALREHILSECRRLNYQGPSFDECAYQAPKSEVIGVMLADSLSYIFSDPMASEVMQGVSEVLTENAKQLLLLCSAPLLTQSSTTELSYCLMLFSFTAHPREKTLSVYLNWANLVLPSISLMVAYLQ